VRNASTRPIFDLFFALNHGVDDGAWPEVEVRDPLMPGEEHAVRRPSGKWMDGIWVDALMFSDSSGTRWSLPVKGRPVEAPPRSRTPPCTDGSTAQ
jgi:hypothetical protein